MIDVPPAVFEGVPTDKLEELLQGLEVRGYPAGTVVIAEGDLPREMFVIRSGSTDVFIADQHGVQHRINRLAPGASFGEMSLFTGQPAAGTVKAAEQLEVLVVGEADFEALGERFPRIYRNLGAVVSERLARANRLILGEGTGRVTVVDDRGAPPLLGYALACSVAWHTRESTLLLVLDDSPPDDLSAIAGAAHEPGKAEVLVLAPDERFVAEGLTGAVEDLRGRYDHVLVQSRSVLPARLPPHRTIALAGDNTTSAPAEDAYALRGWAPDSGRIGPDAAGVVDVPALTASDEHGLSDGSLSPISGAGHALGWAARDLAGLKIGVALGAGSVRGFAHFGALRALERHGLAPDYIAGTSVGAAAAALHALGKTPDEAAESFLACGPTLFRPTISTRGFMSSRSLRKFLQGVTGDTLIENLPLPLATVAADLATFREVVFRSGLLWQAVLTSISIPGIFPAQRVGHYTAVDGGVLNPVPASVAADMGADIVIGVQLGIRPSEPVREARAVQASGRPPSAIQVIMRSIEIMQSRLVPQAGNAATIIVRPELQEIPGARLRSFREGVRYVDDGDAAVEAAMPRIKAAVPWLRA